MGDYLLVHLNHQKKKNRNFSNYIYQYFKLTEKYNNANL